MKRFYYVIKKFDISTGYSSHLVGKHLYEDFTLCKKDLDIIIDFVSDQLCEISYWICETDINYDKI